METDVPENSIKAIPASLVKEKFDGKPFYYQGFREVLSGHKGQEEIIGSSVLQSLLIGLIIRYLGKKLPANMLVATNEAGLHIDRNNNLSNGIALYLISDIRDPFLISYFDFPPKVVIEVDVDIEATGKDFLFEDILVIKTQKMLDFGVQKVIWITTRSRKILVATPHQDWVFTNWDRDVAVFEDAILNLNQLLKDNNIVSNF